MPTIDLIGRNVPDYLREAIGEAFGSAFGLLGERLSLYVDDVDLDISPDALASDMLGEVVAYGEWLVAEGVPADDVTCKGRPGFVSPVSTFSHAFLDGLMQWVLDHPVIARLVGAAEALRRRRPPMEVIDEATRDLDAWCALRGVPAGVRDFAWANLVGHALSAAEDDRTMDTGVGCAMACGMASGAAWAQAHGAELPMGRLLAMDPLFADDAPQLPMTVLVPSGLVKLLDGESPHRWIVETFGNIVITGNGRRRYGDVDSDILTEAVGYALEAEARDLRMVLAGASDKDAPGVDGHLGFDTLMRLLVRALDARLGEARAEGYYDALANGEDRVRLNQYAAHVVSAVINRMLGPCYQDDVIPALMALSEEIEEAGDDDGTFERIRGRCEDLGVGGEGRDRAIGLITILMQMARLLGPHVPKGSLEEPPYADAADGFVDGWGAACDLGLSGSQDMVDLYAAIARRDAYLAPDGTVAVRAVTEMLKAGAQAGGEGSLKAMAAACMASALDAQSLRIDILSEEVDGFELQPLFDAISSDVIGYAEEMEALGNDPFSDESGRNATASYAGEWATAYIDQMLGTGIPGAVTAEARRLAGGAGDATERILVKRIGERCSSHGYSDACRVAAVDNAVISHAAYSRKAVELGVRDGLHYQAIADGYSDGWAASEQQGVRATRVARIRASELAAEGCPYAIGEDGRICLAIDPQIASRRG